MKTSSCSSILPISYPPNLSSRASGLRIYPNGLKPYPNGLANAPPWPEGMFRLNGAAQTESLFDLAKGHSNLAEGPSNMTKGLFI